MALMPCRECAKTVSTQAPHCPHCGAPQPVAPALPPAAKPITFTGRQAAAIFLLATVAVTGMAVYDHRKQPEPAQAAASPASCVRDDLQCLGNRGIASADVYCRASVERAAKHSVKWTDGMLELKFSRFKWRDPLAGTITYVGDRAEFQNGFGAFTPVIYECDLASDERTVLAVRVQEGRLQ